MKQRGFFFLLSLFSPTLLVWKFKKLTHFFLLGFLSLSTAAALLSLSPFFDCCSSLSLLLCCCSFFFLSRLSLLLCRSFSFLLSPLLLFLFRTSNGSTPLAPHSSELSMLSRSIPRIPIDERRGSVSSSSSSLLRSRCGARGSSKRTAESLTSLHSLSLSLFLSFPPFCRAFSDDGVGAPRHGASGALAEATTAAARCRCCFDEPAAAAVVPPCR